MTERVTRAKAIRLKCLECCCGQSAEVRKCHIETCPLWRYRMGREQKDIDFDEYADDFEGNDID